LVGRSGVTLLISADLTCGTRELIGAPADER
jgi:hypothetical protein